MRHVWDGISSVFKFNPTNPMKYLLELLILILMIPAFSTVLVWLCLFMASRADRNMPHLEAGMFSPEEMASDLPVSAAEKNL